MLGTVRRLVLVGLRSVGRPVSYRPLVPVRRLVLVRRFPCVVFIRAVAIVGRLVLVRLRHRVLGLVVGRRVLLVAVVLLVVAAIGGLVLVVVTLVRRRVLGERNEILGHERH